MGAENNLLVKDHTHTFVNKGGQIGGMFYAAIPCFIFVHLFLCIVHNLVFWCRTGFSLPNWGTNTRDKGVFDHKSA